MDNFFLEKYRLLKSGLSKYSGINVAFSGGVDSSVLLYAACEAIGSTKVSALHACSDLLPHGDTERAKLTAVQLGCSFVSVIIDPFDNPGFTRNDSERCYLCKKRIYQNFLRFHEGDNVLVDGSNIDDLSLDRPGRKALAELQVLTPLVDAGLRKADIRVLAREFSLPAWDTPSSSCLATRIPQGEVITREKVILVARCEDIVGGLGFKGARVRFLQGMKIATVTVLQAELSRLLEEKMVLTVNEQFSQLGINSVFFNQEGRQG